MYYFLKRISHRIILEMRFDETVPLEYDLLKKIVANGYNSVSKALHIHTYNLSKLIQIV